MEDETLNSPGFNAPPVVAAVVVFEPGPWFDETLEALARQDYPNLRRLFLITGAPGDVADRIRAVMPDAHVRTVSGNPGYGMAANEVLGLVEGDNGFFCFLHDDVALDPDAITQLVDELYRSNAGIVGPKLVNWNDVRTLQDVGLRADRFGELVGVVEPGDADQEQHDAVSDVFCLPSACLLVRADLFRTLEGFNPAIDFHGDDLDLCWRAHLSGARVVVVPAARARHRAALIERRPDLAHGTVAARHQLLTALTLSSRWRAFTTYLLAPLVALLEILSGLFVGRAGHGVASLRAVGSAIPRFGSISHRRRRVKVLRAVPNREVVRLQARGSARLGALLRRHGTAEVSRDRTRAARRPLRSAGKGTVFAWSAVLVAFVFGSRSIIGRGMPLVGNFLAIPDSASDLLRTYAAGWWPSGFGRSEAAPTGAALLGLANLLSFGSSGVLRLVLVLGPILAGYIGMFHFAAVFRTERGRIAALIVYAANPLPYAAIASGRWAPLAAYGAFPWALELIRRASGIQAASSLVDADGTEVTDAVAVVGVGRQIRVVAALTLLNAIVGAFVPAFPLVVLTAAALMALGTLASRGTAASLVGVGAAAIAAIGAFLLHLPWSGRFLERGGWQDLMGSSDGTGELGIAKLARFEIGRVALGPLALAFLVPLIVATLVARGWRLTWAARCGALVLGFGTLTLIGDRGNVALPEPGVLLVPVAAALAIAAACAVAAFDEDVKGGRIGWQQPVGLVTFVAIAIAVVPAVASVGSGQWRAPRPELAGTLGALPHDPPAGDFRILYVGDARVLPIPGRTYRDGLAFAISDDGPLDARDLWETKPGAAEALVVEALDAISRNTTLRAGHMLAPLGIRYIVVPIIDGLRSTRTNTIPEPVGLQDAFADQLDLRRSSYVSDLAIVYENTTVIPLRSTLSGPAAEASQTAGAAALVGADLSGSTSAFVGQDHPDVAEDALAAGTLYYAVGNDNRWNLAVAGERVRARSAFGWSMAYEVPAAGPGRLSYATPTARRLFVGLQAVLWAGALVATSRFQGWRRWWLRRQRRAAAAGELPVIRLDPPDHDVMLRPTDIGAAP